MVISDAKVHDYDVVRSATGRICVLCSSLRSGRGSFERVDLKRTVSFWLKMFPGFQISNKLLPSLAFAHMAALRRLKIDKISNGI